MSARSPRPLRYRMIRLSWITVAALLLASYVSMFLLLRQQAQRELDRRLRSTAVPVLQHFEATKDKTMADLGEFGSPGQYFEILDASGEVLQVSSARASGLDLPAVNWTNLRAPAWGYSHGPDGRRLRVLALPFARLGQQYTLVAALSTFGMNHILDDFGKVAAVTLGVGLLLAGLISAWYVDKSLEPVRALTAHAELMADRMIHPRPGKSWQPLPLPAPQDEIERLTFTFNRLFSHADRAMRQLRQFISDASHEIRTPLAVLRAESELLLSGSLAPADVQRAVGGMDQELRRLTHIVEGLLTLSLADAGQLRLLREPVYLNEVLEDACALVTARAAAKQVTLARALGQGAAYDGDEAFLHELFVILLDNAVKYSPAGAQVEVTLRADTEEIEVAFRDHGPGVAPAEVEHIFERFYRSVNPAIQSQSGSGLGLCIAQAIATAHGGAVSYRAAEGGGSRFAVRLPQAAVGAVSRGPAPEEVNKY